MLNTLTQKHQYMHENSLNLTTSQSPLDCELRLISSANCSGVSDRWFLKLKIVSRRWKITNQKITIVIQLW